MAFGLFGQEVELRLLPEKGSYLPGEAVHVWVSLHASADLAIRSGRVELIQTRRYTFTEESSSSKGSGRQDVTRTERHVVAHQPFLAAGTIGANIPFEGMVIVRIPDRAEPSGEGQIIATTWRLEAILDVPTAPDVRAEETIAVVVPREVFAATVEQQATVKRNDECRLAFSLPGDAIRAGDVLQGALVLEPFHYFDIRGLRVELIRREEVQPPPDADDSAAGKSVETIVEGAIVAGEGRFHRGGPQKFPFAVTVPRRAYPTCRTENAAVRWLLKGVVDLPMRFDHSIVQELHCYNGSLAEAAAPTFP